MERESGVVHNGNGVVRYKGQSLTYGELAEEAALLPVPTVALLKKSEWKVIGKPTQRLDLAQKVNGTAIYGIDVHFPGLLTALVIHRPAFGAQALAAAAVFNWLTAACFRLDTVVRCADLLVKHHHGPPIAFPRVRQVQINGVEISVDRQHPAVE